jgi:hypothetical protein
MLEGIAFLPSFPQPLGLMKNAKILKDLEVYHHDKWRNGRKTVPLTAHLTLLNRLQRRVTVSMHKSLRRIGITEVKLQDFELSAPYQCLHSMTGRPG